MFPNRSQPIELVSYKFKRMNQEARTSFSADHLIEDFVLPEGSE